MSAMLTQSVVLNVNKKELYVKVVNDSNEAKKVDLNLSRFGGFKNVTLTTLTGTPEMENNYEQHPVEPKTETVKLKAKQQIEVPAYTFQMYTIKL